MKLYLRKIPIILICTCILFSSCGGTPVQGTVSLPQSTSQSASVEQTKKLLTLAYNEQDGLNPYLTQSSVTIQLADLCFEKMIEIAPDMSIEKRALREISINGLTATLYPDTSYCFADGAAISAQDILASLEAARTSVLHKSELANIEKIELGEGCVIVTLLKPDSLFDYLLALPVLKASEVQSSTPTASGRYVFSDGKLIKNSAYTKQDPNAPEAFELKNVTGYDEIVSALGIGDISMFATESENSFTSTTTSLQSYYKINNLIFLGLNSFKPNSILASTQGRKAISSLIDRQMLADKCYYSRAFPALGAINSFYPCVVGKQTLSPTIDIASAESLLSQLGYVKNEKSGFFEKDNIPLNLGLLVYSPSTNKRYTANSIKEHFAQYGIGITIQETDNFEIYTQKISSHDFDMYIGEIKMYNNMDLSSFLPGGSLSGGLAFSEELIQSYNLMRENSSQAQAFESAFTQQMPYVPLLWRCGTMITAKNIPAAKPSITNVFYNLSSAN